MLKFLKRIKYVFFVILGLAIIIGVLLALRCACDDDTPIIKEGWEPVKTEKTSGPPATWSPWFKPTKADKLLKEWPKGTRIVEVEPQPETVYIAIPEEGEIQVPRGITGVTVYEKGRGDWGFELRPNVGLGATFGPSLNAGVTAGVDVFHVKALHTGPGVCVDSERFSGLWTASYSVWRNVDLRAGGGYSTAGPVGFAGVTLGIE